MDAAAALRGIPGAIVVDGVLTHTGNPLAEQRALAAGRALNPAGDRAVLAVPGEDRLSWLDSFCTQRVSTLAPGQGAETLILDPTGHVRHAASVIDDGSTAWLVVDRADAPAMLAFLRSMRFRLRVDPRNAEAELSVFAGTASATAQVTAAVRAGVPLRLHDAWPAVAEGGWAYATAAPHPGTERDHTEVLVEPGERDRLISGAAAGRTRLVGTLAVDALRIAAWRPRLVDVDARTLPHEMDWLRTAVHLRKGCYRGQETVAKVHNLGHPPRRLVFLQLDGSQSLLPEHGDTVRDGEREAGLVTAAALHYEQGPIALALVRRSTPVDALLSVETAGGAMAASQEVIVPPDAGATATVPRLRRLGARRA